MTNREILACLALGTFLGAAIVGAVFFVAVTVYP